MESKDPASGKLNRLSLVDKLESNKRMTTPKSAKRMSLNLGIPIAPSPTSCKSPRSYIQSEAKSPNILEMIAYQERRVCELKEELLRAESDLENLKKQWHAAAQSLLNPTPTRSKDGQLDEPVIETGKRLVKEGVHIFSQVLNVMLDELKLAPENPQIGVEKRHLDSSPGRYRRRQSTKDKVPRLISFDERIAASPERNKL